MQRDKDRTANTPGAPQTVAETARPLLGGKYEILEEVADSVGDVTYTVRHPILGSRHTVTLLPAELTAAPEALARLREAVGRACLLRHDHLVPVLDLGEEAGRYHVVEACVEAAPLAAAVRNGALPPAEALHVARQLADALAHAHERGVVHGALTPEGILLEPGTPPRAYLRGFVTAALAWERPAVPVALLAYASPERVAGKGVDARSDVFALGLLLFAMLEGRPLLAGAEPEIRAILLGGTAPLLPQFSRIMPAGVSALVARAVRRVPRDRQQSMVQVREEIDACLRRLGSQPPAAASARPARPARPVSTRRPILVIDDSVAELPDADADADEAPPIVRETGVAADEDDGTPAVERTATRPPAPAAAARPAQAPQPANAARRAWAESTPAPVRVRRHGRRPGRLPVAMAITALLGVIVLALGRPLVRLTHAPALGPVAAGAAVALVAPVDAASGVWSLLDPSEESVRPPLVRMLAAAAAPVIAPTPARNLPPRIVGRRPAGTVVGVMEGGSLELSVRATDRNPGDALTYAWSLDGRPVSRRPSWRFAAAPGTSGEARTVTVEVSDRAGARAERTAWRVEVTPRISDANVRDWLARLASAWERKDLATLRLFGVVSDEAEAAAVRRQLASYGKFRVSITNPEIHTDGRYASVAFDRAALDARGRVLASDRAAYRLEKQTTGFVGLRAQ